MGALFGTVGGLLDRRQLTAVWLPLLAFLGGIAGIVVAGAGPDAANAWWDGLDSEVRAVAVVALVVLTVLLGQLLNGQRTALLRLFAGHWPDTTGPRWFRDQLTARHRAAHARRTAADPELFLCYPRRADRVLPTRLGNIIRAGEEHADRYGIDGVAAWPRLYVALPRPFVETFAVTAAAVEGAAVISSLGAVFSLAGGGLATALLGPVPAAATVLAGAAVAAGGYRAAARAAVPYAQLIRTAFDVHRFALLEAMRLELPTGFAQEREQWRQLGKIWYGGWPDSDQAAAVRYPQPAGPLVVSFADPVPAPASPAPSPPAPTPAAAAPTPPAGPVRPFPVRGLLLVAVLVAAGGAALTAGLSGNGDEARAARDLPAFHVLTTGDLYGAGTRDLVGRYTRAAVDEDAPLDASDLGPALDGGLAGRTVTTLPVAGLTTRLGAGRTVDLIVTAGTAERFAGAIVLDQRVSPPVLVLAVPSADAERLLTAAATRTVQVVLVP